MADEFVRNTLTRHRRGGAGGGALSIPIAWLRILGPGNVTPQILDPVTGQGLLSISAEIRVPIPTDAIVDDVLTQSISGVITRVFIVRQIQMDADTRVLLCGEIRPPIPDEFDNHFTESFWSGAGAFAFLAESQGGVMRLSSMINAGQPNSSAQFSQLLARDFDIWTRLRTDAGSIGNVRNVLIGAIDPATPHGCWIGFRDNGTTGEPVRYDITFALPVPVLDTTLGVAGSSATYYYARLKRVGASFRTFYKTSLGEPLFESDWTEISNDFLTSFIFDTPVHVGLFGFTESSTLGEARWQFLRNWVPEASSIGTDPFSNVVRCIHRFAPVTPVGNVGAGLDTLRSVNIPALTLANDLDYFKVRGSGVYASTEADKQLRMTLDGQAVISFGAVIDLENGAWTIDSTFVRVSQTQIRVFGNDLHVHTLIQNGALAGPSGAFHVPRSSLLTVSNLDSTDITLLIQGEGTATDDVVMHSLIIELCRQ